MNIKELNELLIRDKAGWTAAENHITRMDDTAKKQLLGAITPKDFKPPVDSGKVKPTKMGTPPASFDWRSTQSGNHVTSVKNQGGCGSCVGFACTSVIESMVSIEHNDLLNLSVADFFFCSAHGAVCTGHWPINNFNDNLTRGVCQEVLAPYYMAFSDQNIWSGVPTCNANPNRSSNTFMYQNVHSHTTLEGAQNYIATVGPITACFDVYEDFQAYKTGIYTYKTGNYLGGHAVAIVGYCIDATVSGGGYWICKNSWDVSWGMDGYFNIAFGQCKIDVNTKVGVSGITMPSTIYSSLSLHENMGSNPDYLNPNVFTGDANHNHVQAHYDTPCYIWANVKNNGIEADSNVNIAFYVFDPSVNLSWPGQFIGNGTLASLAAGSSAYISTPWTPTHRNASHSCLVAVASCTNYPAPIIVPGNPVPLYAMQIAQCNINISSISAKSDSIIRPFNVTKAGNSGYIKIIREPLANFTALLKAKGIDPNIPEAPGGETMNIIQTSDNKVLGEKVGYKKGEQLELHTQIDVANIKPGTAAIYHVVSYENGKPLGGVAQIILHK